MLNIFILLFFSLPKLSLLFKKKLTNLKIDIDFQFIGVFFIIILFELIQDTNLENPNKEYNRFRLYKVRNINYFKRVFLSSYMNLGVTSIVTSVIINMKFFVFQILFILIIVFWYKFFEEKALFNKLKPTWQLSYIRCWAPTTLVCLLMFSPQLVELVHKLKG